ncbi:phosphatidylserine decarboxylase [Yunchengibacter salinarum]|uniref:phosphatidylserine decarboxylase n=1 Tax=Yunchengibacter salinarum TaxID=3133399 RepID=UPI0035B64790
MPLSVLRRLGAAVTLSAALMLPGPNAGAAPSLPDEDTLLANPCGPSLVYLIDQYQTDPATRAALEKVLSGLKDMPQGYAYHGSRANPWRVQDADALLSMMVTMFSQWCVTLPEIHGTSDNALDPILYFAWFFYQNQYGQDFVQGRDPNAPDQPLETGQQFLAKWNSDYLAYMNSAESDAKVPEWVADPRIEIDDYKKTSADQYDSWNSFFTRQLKTNPDGTIPSRPVTMPDRDYVIVSPTDCIMNPLIQMQKMDATYDRTYVEDPLQYDTILDIKGIPLSMSQLLANTPEDLKEQFVGGTGLSCVLMPNTYHHFHSPVDGKIVHAEIVETGSPFATGTFGYIDYPNWVPLDGNVGRLGTDYSQFQVFQRGVIIIKVTYENLPGRTPETLTGYVASIPVGLDSVGSVEFDPDVAPGLSVKKGVTRFGNFNFGGSLNILLFSKGLVGNEVQTRMGNQIAIINAGTAPKSPWSLD